MNFHEKDAIADPKAVEKVFIEMHAAYQSRKVCLSRIQSSYTVKILTGDEDQAKHAAYDLATTSWQFAGFFKRCEMFPIKYSPSLKLWLAVINFEYGIGAMILVAYYVQWWTFNNEAIRLIACNRDITLTDIIDNCFPFGIFDKETIHEFWDKQKVKCSPDNLIDYPSATYSFMPIERKEPISNEDHIWA